MTEPSQVAALIDEVAARVDGVVQVYRAEPVSRVLGARRVDGPKAHVLLVPAPSVRVSVAVADDRAAGVTATAVAAAVRAALPEDWHGAAVHVQVRRITSL